jgi:pilus assembly protein Flp/PilA
VIVRREADALSQREGALEKGGDRNPMMLLDALISLFWYRDEEEGQGLAEYALILALIAIVAIIALIFLGGQVKTLLSNVGSSI